MCLLYSVYYITSRSNDAITSQYIVHLYRKSRDRDISYSSLRLFLYTLCEQSRKRGDELRQVHLSIESLFFVCVTDFLNKFLLYLNVYQWRVIIKRKYF